MYLRPQRSTPSDWQLGPERRRAPASGNVPRAEFLEKKSPSFEVKRPVVGLAHDFHPYTSVETHSAGGVFCVHAESYTSKASCMEVVERCAEKPFAEATPAPLSPNAERTDPSQVTLACALRVGEEKTRQLVPVRCEEPK
jgi:hypothetical protein